MTEKRQRAMYLELLLWLVEEFPFWGFPFAKNARMLLPYGDMAFHATATATTIIEMIEIASI
jgi:hypothetical protein